MRIGLDARSLFSPQARGTGRNLRDVVRQLAVLRPGDELFLYHRADPGESCASQTPAEARRPPVPADGDDRGWQCAPNVRVRPVDCPGDRFDLWMQVRLPLAAWCDRLDVLHMPANAVPIWSPVPIAATIHDLIPLTDAGDADARAVRRFARNVKRALKAAARIITPSEFTRNELIEKCGADGERISVVPWAPDTALTRPVSPCERLAEEGQVRAAFDLPGRWILNFSGRSKRKNPDALVAAFAALPRSLRSETVLVLSGCEPVGTRDRLTALARGLDVLNRCRFLGFRCEREAAALLRGAGGLAMPSLAEGFGLPLLDAMACGVPVLASAGTSLAEIAGDAAIFVDPRDIASIRDGLAELIEGRWRARQVERGRARAAQFTWERSAAALVDVYEQCARRPPYRAVLKRAEPRVMESAI